MPPLTERDERLRRIRARLNSSKKQRKNSGRRKNRSRRYQSPVRRKNSHYSPQHRRINNRRRSPNTASPRQVRFLSPQQKPTRKNSNPGGPYYRGPISTKKRKGENHEDFHRRRFRDIVIALTRCEKELPMRMKRNTTPYEIRSNLKWAKGVRDLIKEYKIEYAALSKHLSNSEVLQLRDMIRRIVSRLKRGSPPVR